MERDTLTVSEVSKLAGIPRPNAYEALEKLMSKGMCIARPGDTKKYSASHPALLEEKFVMELNRATEVELEDLNKRQRETLQKSKAALETQLENLNEREREIIERNKAARESISVLAKELTPQYENSRLDTNPLEYIEIIRDPYQIHKRFMQLVNEAKKEILIFTKPPYSGPKEWLEKQTEQQLDPLQQGIRIRSIYEISKNEEEIEWWIKDIGTAVKHGEEARVIKELPMKMAIFDSRIVIYLLEDPVSKQTSFTAQIVEHRALAKSLKILFETFWEQAEDYHILKD